MVRVPHVAPANVVISRISHEQTHLKKAVPTYVQRRTRRICCVARIHVTGTAREMAQTKGVGISVCTYAITGTGCAPLD